MNAPALGIRGRRREKLTQGGSSLSLPSVASALFLVSFALTPVRENDQFVELAAPEEVGAYISAVMPEMFLNQQGEVLVRRVPVPEEILSAYLSTQIPGWDGRAVSIAARSVIGPPYTGRRRGSVFSQTWLTTLRTPRMVRA